MKITVKKGGQKLFCFIFSVFFMVSIFTEAWASGTSTKPKTDTKVIITTSKAKRISNVAKTKVVGINAATIAKIGESASATSSSTAAGTTNVARAKVKQISNLVSSKTGTNAPANVSVSNFEELQLAISNKVKKIDIKVPAIDFSQEMLVMHSIIIDSLEEDRGSLDGKDQSSFFRFNSNLAEILLKNIEFNSGRNKRTEEDSGGGALEIKGKMSTVTLENDSFINNIADSSGGAIYSFGNADSRNTLIFKEEAIFGENKNNKGFGGAICAKFSKLIFDGDVYFTENNSYKSGGAMYSEGDETIKNILNFRESVFFKENTSGSTGGAICAKFSNLNFEDQAIFDSNASCDYGGAIHSEGSVTAINVLTFRGSTIFKCNKSEFYSGGAIRAEYSRLNFEKKGISNRIETGPIYSKEDIAGGDIVRDITFLENSSSGSGGAIYSSGSATSRAALNFRGVVVFENNRSVGADGGGAIFGNHLDLNFREKAVFRNNCSGTNGGAIFAGDGSSLIFNGPAVFWGNQAKMGSVIFAVGQINIDFVSGLIMAGNTTLQEFGDSMSAAIHMNGYSNDCRAKISISSPAILQLNKTKTDFCASNAGIYMEQYSTLNFVLKKKGDIEIYDRIGGSETGRSNNIAIDGKEGQFNLREKSSIYNVNLENNGKINFAGSSSASNLYSFKNSGKIILAILPENNRCGKIRAEDIILEKNSELEIVAAEGAYKKGNSYDILVSKNTIAGAENINVKLPNNLKVRGEFQDKFYRLFIDKDGVIGKVLPRTSSSSIDEKLRDIDDSDENSDNESEL
ncbi:MAG: hypothetical protein LBP39_03700 [Rickettsiales bacterium]|jgi:predicted outer membrane repeat protein|nr:hypothetical protein [Rickettsiales bacterium]